MATWDEGWLPGGWTRGDPIYMHNSRFRSGPRACFSPVLVRPFAASDAELCAILFYESEVPRILSWLRWFYDLSTPDADFAMRLAMYHNIAAQLR